MANNLEYWDGKLHLEKMRELIKVVLVNQSHGGDNFELRDIEYDKKLYNISIKGDVLHINCKDGRDLYISLLAQDDFKANFVPQLNYVMGKENLIVTGDSFNRMGINLGEVFNTHFVDFDDFYNNEQLIRKIIFNTFNGTHWVSLRFNGINNFVYTICHSVFGKNYYLKINDYSIIFNDGGNDECLMSIDDERIFKYNGIKVPSFEAIKDFDESEEVKKVNNVLNNHKKELNAFTLDCLGENLCSLEEKQSLRDQFMKLYQYKLPICREALQKRNELLNNIDSYTFRKDELTNIIILLKEEIITRINNNENVVVKKKSLNR